MLATYKTSVNDSELCNQAASATKTFLFKNQEALVELLRQVGEFECAADVAALNHEMKAGAHHQVIATEVLIEAEQRLMESPIHNSRPHGSPSSDLDAALRWMGARLSEHVQLMKSFDRQLS